MMSNPLNQLIEKHLSTLNTQGEELITALENGQYEEARMISHTLKGASGSLGFRRYMEISQKIENECKEKLKTSTHKFQPELTLEFRSMLKTLRLEDSEIYNGTPNA